MPSVNLSPETYEKLKALAEQRRCSPDAAAEDFLERELGKAARELEQWRAQWDAALGTIRSGVPEALTVEEADTLADEAVAYARAKRARSH